MFLYFVFVCIYISVCSKCSERFVPMWPKIRNWTSFAPFWHFAPMELLYHRCWHHKSLNRLLWLRVKCFQSQEKKTLNVAQSKRCLSTSNKKILNKIECKISIYHNWFGFGSNLFIWMKCDRNERVPHLGNDHFHFLGTHCYGSIVHFIHERKYCYWDIPLSRISLELWINSTNAILSPLRIIA